MKDFKQAGARTVDERQQSMKGITPTSVANQQQAAEQQVNWRENEEIKNQIDRVLTQLSLKDDRNKRITPVEFFNIIMATYEICNEPLDEYQDDIIP